MNGTYKKKTYWANKAAFFGLFIAALLIARFVVLWKSAIVLSGPIKLEFAGLSVCMPMGNGWQTEKQWKYEQSSFALGSFLASGSSSITTLVSCRYLLAAEKAAPEVLFEEKASEVGGTVAETGRIETGGAAEGSQGRGVPAIDWARIEKSKTQFHTFVGVVQLPNNRRLDIEVHQAVGDAGMAEEIFKAVAGGLEFTDNRMLEAGGKIVSEIKNKGLESFLSPRFADSDLSAKSPQGDGREIFFLIKDEKESTIGFAMEVMDSRLAEKPQADVEPEAQLNITAGSFYYIGGRYGQEQAAFFQSDNSFSEFIWRGRTSRPGGRGGTEIVGKDGIMTVKQFSRRVEEKNYQIGPAAMPDVLSEFIFSQMLDSDLKEILVDIIEADGEIIPACIRRAETPNSFDSQNQSGGIDVAGEEPAHVFSIELLDGRGFSEQVYLDGQMQVLRILLRHENIYILERTSTENLLKEFPEQGSYILQSSARGALQQEGEMSEGEQPQEDSK
ncbi:MAG: hypothetical protein PHY02_02115 [Phycisphaerae bacterium]|nr:hypothetical protein [Phycisphaerae bacterium]